MTAQIDENRVIVRKLFGKQESQECRFRSGKGLTDDPCMSERAPSSGPGGTPNQSQLAPERAAQLDLVESADGSETARPWLGIWYKCANKYVKVFRSPDGQTYTARCPKCGEATRFRVGEGGVSTRFFEIQC